MIGAALGPAWAWGFFVLPGRIGGREWMCTPYPHPAVRAAHYRALRAGPGTATQRGGGPWFTFFIFHS